jgi:ABC-2 type transport system permease protein
MSLADLTTADAPAPDAPGETVERSRAAATGRLLASELRLVLGRRRNQVLLAGLGAVPLLLGTVLWLTRDSAIAGQGPSFVGQVTQNGLFLVVASLFLCLPFLLPLTIGITSGDAIAGEASTGTLRYLVLAVAVVGLVVGAAYFGLHDVTLLSGSSVPLGEGVLRVAGIVLYVGLSLTGLVAVGLFFSTLTEVPVGAMAATVVVAIVSTVLDSLPQVSAIHPGLLTHHWFDFAELLRLQVDPGVLAQGMVVQAVWVAIFGSLAWSRFTTADVTS